MADSSNSQHSHHSTSTSDPVSGTASGDNSSGEIISTGRSTMKRKTSSGDDQPEDEKEIDPNTANSKPPTEHLPESSNQKGKTIATTATTAAMTEGTEDEIGLLTDLYALQSKTGRYVVLSGRDDGLRDFYKFWIEEEGDYVNKEELDEKISELHARFLKNMDRNVDGPVDPLDVEILRLSHWIWGHEIDSDEETDDDDQK